MSRIDLPHIDPPRPALAWTEHVTQLPAGDAPLKAFNRLCDVFTPTEIANPTVVIEPIDPGNQSGIRYPNGPQDRIPEWRTARQSPQPPAMLSADTQEKPPERRSNGTVLASLSQSNAMKITSATNAGFPLPSNSTVLSNIIRTPPFTSSTPFKTYCSRTRDPDGTTDVKRTLFVP